MKAGLLHPNCRHTLATYFPDVTILPTVPDRDKALEAYEAEQRQRGLERRIRKWKRKAEGACDEQGAKKARGELRRLQKRLRDYLKEHPELRRDYNREKIHETLKENLKKIIEKPAVSGIMRLPRYEEAVIPEEKFTEYALNPDKDPDKAKAFKLALGYDLTNYKELINNIRSHLSEFEAVEKPDAGYGSKYEVVMELTGPNGKTATVLTGWIDDKKNGEMRLTTPHVARRGHGHKDV